MKVRVLTALVMVAVLIPFLIFSDTFAWPLLICAMTAIGIFEMLRCTGMLRKIYAAIPAFLVGVGFPAVLRLLEANGIDPLRTFFILGVCLTTWNMISCVFSKGGFTMQNALMTAGMTLYISFGFSVLILLRDMENGKFVFLLSLLIPWMSDVFAYFTGVLFGKHKLIPEVSPKKTIEGSVGGLIAGTVIAVLYVWLIAKLSDAEADLFVVALAAFVTAALSQVGDLIMSVIKREYGIKDYGTLFPGHGGILDRFDSVLVTTPFLYFLLTLSETLIVIR
ncbi:MAG: phosphatidate cytidylyltransferase [Lachnospiraceae bacterium]|nr:phosphatidate cytidylyltransferase [Lachnospiraceae bacterium]